MPSSLLDKFSATLREQRQVSGAEEVLAISAEAVFPGATHLGASFHCWVKGEIGQEGTVRLLLNGSPIATEKWHAPRRYVQGTPVLVPVQEGPLRLSLQVHVNNGHVTIAPPKEGTDDELAGISAWWLQQVCPHQE